MKHQEHIPERISSAGKKIPFEVPDSYFESFPGKLQERLTESRKPHTRSIRPQLAIAAMFIGLITVGYAGFRILSSPEKPIYFSSEEMTEAIEYFAYEVDDEMLVSAIIEADISFSPSSSDLLGDEIVQYLSEEDIDISDLMIE